MAGYDACPFSRLAEVNRRSQCSINTGTDAIPWQTRVLWKIVDLELDSSIPIREINCEAKLSLVPGPSMSSKCRLKSIIRKPGQCLVYVSFQVRHSKFM